MRIKGNNNAFSKRMCAFKATDECNRQILVLHKEFQLLKISHDNIFGLSLPFSFSLFFITHCFVNYTLIRNTGIPLNYIFAILLGNLTCYFFSYLFLKSGGQVSTCSVELKRLMYSTSSSSLKREIDACPILNAVVGPIKLNKGSLNTYYSTLTDYVIQLLLYSRPH